MNPFAQTMVRLELPPGMGRSVSVSGFTVEADADGCVEVPKHIAEELKHHGLRPVAIGASAADTAPKAKK